MSYVPYAHVFIRDIFPREYYRCILEALPHAHESHLFDKRNKDDRSYHRISGGDDDNDARNNNNNNRKVELGGRGARTQWRNRFWRDFSRTFAGSEIRDAWMGLFRRSLAPRFPDVARYLSSSSSSSSASSSSSKSSVMSEFEIRLDLSRDGKGEPGGEGGNQWVVRIRVYSLDFKTAQLEICSEPDMVLTAAAAAAAVAAARGTPQRVFKDLTKAWRAIR